MNILIIFTSYLLGSLPTGFLIGKYLKNIDLRTMGSGSTGATNVLRNVGKWPALFVFIIDVGKGLIAVKISQKYRSKNYRFWIYRCHKCLEKYREMASTFCFYH